MSDNIFAIVAVIESDLAEIKEGVGLALRSCTAIMQKMEEAGLVSTTGEILNDLDIISVAIAENSAAVTALTDMIGLEDDPMEPDAFFLNSDPDDFPVGGCDDGGYDPSEEDGDIIDMSGLLGAPTVPPSVAPITFHISAETEEEAARQLSEQLIDQADAFLEAGIITEDLADILSDAATADFGPGFLALVQNNTPHEFESDEDIMIETPEQAAAILHNLFMNTMRDHLPEAYQKYTMLIVLSAFQYELEGIEDAD